MDSKDKKKVAYIARQSHTKLNILSECSCDAPKENHHPDYSRPQDVHRLCSKCHTAWHVKERYPNAPDFRFTEAAKIIGIDNSYLSRIYHGHIVPGEKVATRLAAFFKTTIKFWKGASRSQIQKVLDGIE